MLATCSVKQVVLQASAGAGFACEQDEFAKNWVSNLRQKFETQVFLDRLCKLAHYTSSRTSPVFAAVQKHQKHRKLIPAAASLAFVAMNLFRPPPKTKRGNQFLLVTTGRLCKSVRSVPLQTTTDTVVASAFLDHLMYTYSGSAYVLTAHGRQIVAKVCDAASAMLGARQYLTAAPHPQTSGQIERFSETIVQRLRHYLQEHHRDWEIYFQPLRHAYDFQVYRSTESIPLTLSFQNTRDVR